MSTGIFSSIDNDLCVRSRLNFVWKLTMKLDVIWDAVDELIIMLLS